MLNRQACRCASCTARDAAEFERIIATFVPSVSWPDTSEPTDSDNSELVARINAY